MTVVPLWLALRGPNVVVMITTRWSLRWYVIVAALLIPVVLLRFADSRIRAAA